MTDEGNQVPSMTDKGDQVPLSEVGFSGPRNEETRPEREPSTGSASLLRGMEALLTQLVAANQPRQSSVPQLVKLDPDEPEAATCYACGKVGHLVSTCPNRTNGNVGNVTTKEVHACQQQHRRARGFLCTSSVYLFILCSYGKMQPKTEVVDVEFADITNALEEAEQVIRTCFTQYALEEVFLSFNGGKDCTVLLDITLNVLKDLYRRPDIGKDFKVVYIRSNGSFREMEAFVKEIEEYYGVNLVVTEGALKATLERLLSEDERLKACLMGTRRTDPYSSNMEFMQKTDANWPQVMRVSPLLNWTYHQIWTYILQRNVPYCTLYDKGYTSIGSTHNTWPNPALAYKDRYGALAYHPAYRLTDPALERAGRTPPTNGRYMETCHCTITNNIL